MTWQPHSAASYSRQRRRGTFVYPAEAPTPKPALDAVLIKIYATAAHRADLLQRRGFYPPPGESDLIGLEAAGVIVEKAIRFRTGNVAAASAACSAVD